MNKKRISIVLLLILLVSSLHSLEIPKTDRLAFYLSPSVSPAFVTEKVFSYPAKNGNVHFALGGDFTCNIYKNDESAKCGLSLNLYGSYPLISKSYKEFKETDLTDKKGMFNLSFGPVFRFTPSDYLDASLSLRLGVMSYDYFREGIMLSLTIEQGLDYFLSDNLFLTFSINLTDGFIKFTPFSSSTWYDNGYSTAIIRARIGAGYLIGGDRKR